jgi:hypothetical protein
LSGTGDTITAKSPRATERTSLPITFPDKQTAPEFVNKSEGFLFSGREYVYPGWKRVACGWFVKQGDKLADAGQDWCPPEPMHEPGDVHPSCIKIGKIAVVREVRTGDAAKKMGFGAVIVVEERDATAN